MVALKLTSRFCKFPVVCVFDNGGLGVSPLNFCLVQPCQGLNFSAEKIYFAIIEKHDFQGLANDFSSK